MLCFAPHKIDPQRPPAGTPAQPARPRCAYRWPLAVLALVLASGGQALSAESPRSAIAALEVHAFPPGAAPGAGDGSGDSNGSGGLAMPGHVSDLAQTEDGRLWLATGEGLMAYDGRQLRRFDQSEYPTLTSEHIVCLLADPEGLLWVGTRGGGLLRFDGTTFWPIARPGAPGESWSVDLLFEHEETLWIGTPEDLLFLERKATASFHGLPGVGISGIAPDPFGNIWVSAGTGVFRRVQAAFQPLSLPLVLASAPIHDLALAADSELVLGREDGLFRLRGSYEHTGLPQTAEAVKGLEGRAVLHLETDGADLWLGTNDGQVYRLDSQGRLELLPLPIAQTAPISALLLGRNRTLWVGTAGAGLLRASDPSLPADAPRVAIDRLQWDGFGVRPRKGLILDPKVDSIRIDLAAALPSRDRLPDLQYRYFVDGEPQTGGVGASAGGSELGDNAEGSAGDTASGVAWIGLEDEDLDLDPLSWGRHRVEVRAGIDGAWSEPSAVTWVIETPIWARRSLWTLALGAIGLLIGLRTFLIWRQRRYEAWLMEMEAEEFADGYFLEAEESGLVSQPSEDPGEGALQGSAHGGRLIEGRFPPASDRSEAEDEPTADGEGESTRG